jgi:hypothetical protein
VCLVATRCPINVLCCSSSGNSATRVGHCSIATISQVDRQPALSWFLTYAAVQTTDERTRNLLTCGRFVVREAQRHSGPGWLEYDRIFRQHAALSATTAWHELNPSLHASTILSYRADPSRVCAICHKPDHTAEACAMQALQSTMTQPPPPRPQSNARPGISPPSGGPTCRPVGPETLERTCVSWNKGRCTFPNCNFRHICSTCKKRGQRARDCEDTPADSAYKSLSPPQQVVQRPPGAQHRHGLVNPSNTRQPWNPVRQNLDSHIVLALINVHKECHMNELV